MKIKSRTTYNFIELKTDSIEVTLFKHEQAVDETIQNLLDIVRDLSGYTTTPITEFMKPYLDDL